MDINKEMLKQAAAQVDQPPAMVLAFPPTPRPVAIQAGHVPSRQLVSMAVHTEVGVQTVFLTPDYADKVALELADQARRARSGLTLPG